MCIYIYMYIDRERERGRERQVEIEVEIEERERERERETLRECVSLCVQWQIAPTTRRGRPCMPMTPVKVTSSNHTSYVTLMERQGVRALSPLSLQAPRTHVLKVHN